MEVEGRQKGTRKKWKVIGADCEKLQGQWSRSEARMRRIESRKRKVRRQLVGDEIADRELLIFEINTRRSGPGPKQEKESTGFGSGGRRRPWGPSTYSFFSESPFQMLSGIGDTKEEKRREETSRRDRRTRFEPLRSLDQQRLDRLSRSNRENRCLHWQRSIRELSITKQKFVCPSYAISPFNSLSTAATS
ncbi:uncharacterized protein LOC143174200 [Nomia melanderi]|uniref:uncharacterized protein LOC143174200 n=1 Tax=Nomia melanderi TaxID=2448451 RepID=UPI003FCDA67E